MVSTIFPIDVSADCENMDEDEPPNVKMVKTIFEDEFSGIPRVKTLGYRDSGLRPG